MIKPKIARRFEGDPFEFAVKIIDKYIPFFHSYGKVNLSSVRYEAKAVLTDEEYEYAPQLEDKIEILLFNKFKYLEKRYSNDFEGELTNEGRAAKSAGGHFAYLKKLDAEKAFQKRKEEIDLKSKEWIYKYRRLPFILSGCALGISIVALMFTALKYFHDTPKKELNSELNQPQIKKQISLDTMNTKSKSGK